jgi:cation:H+ antiporter
VLLALDGSLGRGDGVFLLAGLAGYLVALGLLARGERLGVEAGEYRILGWVPSVAFLVGGSALLALGADILVTGAVDLARDLGVGEVVVGLTIVAVGTSLPELATSVAAAVRNQRDLAVGNVLGSNIFNVLGVLGAGAVASGGIPVTTGVYMLDFPVMIAVSLACLPVFLTDGSISRREGGVFLFYYVLYVTYLGLHATEHQLHEEFGITVLGVVLPLTLAVAVPMWLRVRRSSGDRSA